MVSKMLLCVLTVIAVATAASAKVDTPNEQKGCPLTFDSGPWTGHAGRGDDAISSTGHGNAVSGGSGRDAIPNTGTSGPGGGSGPGGASGNDSISSSGYGNKVRGGTGSDTIASSGASNTVKGGRGWDNVGSIGYGNYAQGPRATDWTYKKPAANGLGWQMDFIAGESCCYARSGSGAACSGR